MLDRGKYIFAYNAVTFSSFSSSHQTPLSFRCGLTRRTKKMILIYRNTEFKSFRTVLFYREMSSLSRIYGVKNNPFDFQRSIFSRTKPRIIHVYAWHPHSPPKFHNHASLFKVYSMKKRHDSFKIP